MQRIFACVFVCAMAGGCAAPFETTSTGAPVVPMSLVLNSLKCGLAEAIYRDTGDRSGLYGAVAKVEIDANVVHGFDTNGKVSVGIPIFSGAAIGSLTPSLGFTHSEVSTYNTSIDFDVSLISSSIKICDGVRRGQDTGFSAWIGAIVADINVAVGGPPRARMKQYVYETDLTVKTTGTAGLEFEIVPIKLTAGAGASRSDVQHLKIAIDAVHKVPGGFKPHGPDFSAPFVRPRRGQ